MVQLYHGYILHSKRFPTTPHMPKSELNEEVMAPTSWTKKTIATEKTLPRQSFCCNRETLSRQRKLCRYQVFCCNRENSVATKFSIATEKLYRDKVFCCNRETLSQQRKFYRNRVFYCNRRNSVTTEKTLSRQRKLFRDINAGKNQKSPKMYILVCFQAHFTIGL